MQTKTADEIDKEYVSKGEHLGELWHYPYSYDGGLPNWFLDEVHLFALRNPNSFPGVTSDLIRSTSVWCYPPQDGFIGRPLTFCEEVKDLFQAYFNSIHNRWSNDPEKE